ncbi:hypothetical protein HK104_003821 [Borealophlyctis nickersoniae]|nr:hypothetical protein HK104_003821 [Borealophlyctis nickersoniae]
MRLLFTSTLLALSCLLPRAHSSPTWPEQLKFDLSLGEKVDVGFQQGGTIVDRLRQDERFTKLVEALAADRGLRDDLENRKTKSTLFAPTNEAFKRIEESVAQAGSTCGDDEKKPSIHEILRYHIIRNEEINGDDLCAGRLLRTDLKLRSLKDQHQRIRVYRFHGDTYLNMMSRVVDKDIQADNGKIHVVDRVLVPPRDALHTLKMLPTEFSILVIALYRSDLHDMAKTGKGITVFAPTNRAWERLGYRNLAHLFGSEKGKEDLKKIVEFHASVATDLAYSIDMMEQHKLKVHTLHKDQLLELEARKRRDISTKKHECDAYKYLFLINHGEAVVRFADGIAANGVVHMINDVLIPDDVKLPHDTD